ncbi:MAG: UbiD family decarboxylase domain-containing protein, partial [Candidatus Thorarchaeota archaeon]
MSFRSHIKRLAARGDLITISEPISTTYEIAGVLKELEPKPVLFEHPQETKLEVVGNLFPSKTSFADYFDLSTDEIIPTLAAAIEQRSPPSIVAEAPCQEVVISNPDLNQLPILRHFNDDGGRYITSGVVVARHPGFGGNLDFHRCMQFSSTEMAMRIVAGRHFDV